MFIIISSSGGNGCSGGRFVLHPNGILFGVFLSIEVQFYFATTRLFHFRDLRLCLTPPRIWTIFLRPPEPELKKSLEMNFSFSFENHFCRIFSSVAMAGTELYLNLIKFQVDDDANNNDDDDDFCKNKFSIEKLEEKEQNFSIINLPFFHSFERSKTLHKTNWLSTTSTSSNRFFKIMLKNGKTKTKNVRFLAVGPFAYSNTWTTVFR